MSKLLLEVKGHGQIDLVCTITLKHRQTCFYKIITCMLSGSRCGQQASILIILIIMYEEYILVMTDIIKSLVTVGHESLVAVRLESLVIVGLESLVTVAISYCRT